MNNSLKSFFAGILIASSLLTTGAFAQGYGGGGGSSNNNNGSIVFVPNGGQNFSWSNFLAPVVRITGQVLGASTTATTTNLTTASTTLITIVTVDRNLRFGASGQEVTDLQHDLIVLHLLALQNPTGFFGPVTLDAVRRFQALHNIPVTGYVGPLTRTVLNSGTQN